MASFTHLIRDEIRALAAYHVQPAKGMVKLDAMESKLPPYRVVIQYVPGCDEPLVCLTAFFPDEL